MSWIMKNYILPHRVAMIADEQNLDLVKKEWFSSPTSV